jgi:hypothetical protein
LDCPEDVGSSLDHNVSRQTLIYTVSHRRIITDGPKLQTFLNRLGEWTVEKEMKLNPDKRKRVSFTKDRVKD